MNIIYLSLGSNLGQRELYLEEAIKLIQSRIGMVGKCSSFYESEPWGFSSENSFCNCCLSLQSNLEAIALLDELLSIEKEMGRERIGSAYTDRIIDIDMLFYGQQQIDHPRLSIPHPSMVDRKFVLFPLAEIAPDLLHPVSGKSISQLLQECSDQTGLAVLKQK